MTKYEYDKAVYASDMDKNAKAVALCYAFHSDWKTGGGIYVSHVGVADKTGLHRNTVRKWTDWLVEEGWLTPVGKTQKNVTRFELSIPASAVAQPVCNSTDINFDIDSEQIEAVAQKNEPVAQNNSAVAQPVSTNVIDLNKNLILAESKTDSSQNTPLEIKEWDEEDDWEPSFIPRRKELDAQGQEAWLKMCPILKEKWPDYCSYVERKYPELVEYLREMEDLIFDAGWEFHPAAGFTTRFEKARELIARGVRS